jgi:F420-dependent oxidoreductase-like protein
MAEWAGRVRFGLVTAPQNTTWQDVLAVWRTADQIPLYESAWTFDHFYPILSDPTGPCLEGWTTLTALAQATERLRLGVMVTGMVYRHPAVLANMASTLDIISEGRLELGLGAGWNEEECLAYGIPLGTLQERFDRFDEGCEAIVGLLTDETTDLEGAYYRLEAARCEPKPIQQPLPICIGGQGERRTLRTAAKWAHHWNAGRVTADQLRNKRRVLAAHCRDVGRNAGDISTSVLVIHRPGDSPAKVAEEAAAYAEAGADMAIISLGRHDPAVIEPLAQALEPLAGTES